LRGFVAVTRQSRRGFLGVTAGAVGTQSVAVPGESRRNRQSPGGGAVFDVTRFGAVGDGRTKTTQALQSTIDACAAAGGGTVLVPAGRYESGALFMRSHVDLHLAAGATLAASPRPEDFPPIRGREEGVERKVHSSLVTGLDLVDVSITGRGALEGRGEVWTEAYRVTRKMRMDLKLPREADDPPGAPLKWPRPRVVNFIRCRNVLVEGITVADMPCYGLHLLYCDGVAIVGVTTRLHEWSGTTAMIIDSSRRVRIADCDVADGSEGIGIKAGYNEDGRRVGIPAEDILITGCQFSRLNSTAVAIGSETAGSIRNVCITSCVVHDSSNGIHVRAPRGRGGVVERIRAADLVLDGVTKVALKISHYYDSLKMNATEAILGRRNLETAASRTAAVDEGTPTFRDFAFCGLTLGGPVELVALIEGLPERPIRGIVLADVDAPQALGGISCNLAAEIAISNFAVGTLASCAVDAREVEEIEVHRLRAPRPWPEGPAVWLENVAGALVHGCVIGDGGPGYRWLRHEQSRDVVVGVNRLPPSR
jgi:polygalacturonase